MAATREEVFERVKEVLTEQLGVDENEVTEEASFQEDLDAELLRQDFLDPLEHFLSRCCHLTSLAGGFRARGC